MPLLPLQALFNTVVNLRKTDTLGIERSKSSRPTFIHISTVPYPERKTDLLSHIYVCLLMEIAILSAGSGSRLGLEKELPKSFADINGRTILERQLAALYPLIQNGEVSNTVNLVLGYGFENDNTPKRTVENLIDVPDEINLNCIVLPYWSVTENTASALAALNVVNDHLLLLCGDVIFTPRLIKSFIYRFHDELQNEGFSSVGVIEGIQNEMTAVLWNDEKQVVNYGAIDGHQEVGIFVLNRCHFEKAGSLWISNAREQWFPTIFEEVPTKAITVSEDERAEINTKEQLKDARRAFE